MVGERSLMTEHIKLKATLPWWVHSDCADDVQALVGGGFKNLPVARASFFAFSQVTANGQWILDLGKVAPVTPASDTIEGQDKAVALGFTASGLQLCGLDPDDIAAFGSQFKDGMTEPSRARRLGDIAAERLQWSGSRSSLTQVHMVLITYCENEASLSQWCEEIEDVLNMNGINLRHYLNLELRADGSNTYREHFGFADGISQPIPTDEESDSKDRPAFARRVDSNVKNQDLLNLYHQVSSGDFLFGRENSYGEIAPSPYVSEKSGTVLAKGNAPIGFRDFAYNGTFLVVRQLEQDVEGFWRNIHEVANDLGLTSDELAEKIVGRTKDGAILSRHNADSSNQQGFAEHDSAGQYCPLGSHIRRANPRDAGGNSIRSRKSKLSASNKHRILRRGRNYTIEEHSARGAEEVSSRGLLFMCLNTDIRRQFEFIQTTWLNSRHFSNLNETDPLLGSTGTTTIQSQPLRLKPTISSHVSLVGGDYFFMPSLRALKYLSNLDFCGDSV